MAPFLASSPPESGCNRRGVRPQWPEIQKSTHRPFPCESMATPTICLLTLRVVMSCTQVPNHVSEVMEAVKWREIGSTTLRELVDQNWWVSTKAIQPVYQLSAV